MKVASRVLVEQLDEVEHFSSSAANGANCLSSLNETGAGVRKLVVSGRMMLPAVSTAPISDTVYCSPKRNGTSGRKIATVSDSASAGSMCPGTALPELSVTAKAACTDGRSISFEKMYRIWLNSWPVMTDGKSRRTTTGGVWSSVRMPGANRISSASAGACWLVC